MKKTMSTVLATALSVAAFAQDPATPFAQSITATDLKQHLTYLASDELEGRMTGTPGQKKATEYLVKQFQSYGLKGLGPNGSMLQDYELVQRGWGDVYLKTKQGTRQMYQDFYVYGLTSVPEETDLSVVFAGYGIETDSYSDYRDADVAGKAVVILDGEPKKADGTYWLSGTDKETSKWNGPASVQAKAKLAREKGATQVFFVSADAPDVFAKKAKQMQTMSRRLSRIEFRGEPEKISNSAIFYVSEGLGAELLGVSTEKFGKLRADIAKKGTPLTGKAKSTIRLKAARKEEIMDTENVAGFLEGTDKKDEVLLITAHYDHIGVTDGKVNNGANDDGSGTVTVLELAQAFGKAAAEGFRPRRSILFMAVTGEELGLFGSEYYTNNPLIPLDKTIADLNIDMVGRTDKQHEGKGDYIYVIGSDKLSSELHAINESANQKYTQLELDYTFNDPKDPNRFYYRSDHYNFAKNGIPVAFFFNGVHEDYHQPTDDVEKIQFDKAEKVGRLVFYTAWELANRENRIIVDSNKP
jgi:hypothetical protein